jgi:hypothetical protein
VVAGYSYNVGSSYDFALTRYNSNGSLDTTFDGDGKVKGTLRLGTLRSVPGTCCAGRGDLLGYGFQE